MKSKKSSQLFADSLVKLLVSVVGDSDTFVALHEPEFAGNEWFNVKECLDTGWVSSVGKFVDQFEIELAEVVGVSHAVVTVNGTSALHLAMLVAGVERGDEVIMPALTFVATANAVVYAGAIPHFVDSCFDTLGMSPDVLRSYLNDVIEQKRGKMINKHTGRRISAIIPMHTFGHPVDMDKLKRVAMDFNLLLIEDSAEALGSQYNGQPCGSLSDIGTLSFNGNKIITTGGGGALLTNNEQYAKHAKYLSTTAKQTHKWSFIHDEIGYNYRMPNINAALGCAQLPQLKNLLMRKRKLAQQYDEAFLNFEGVDFVREPENSKSNYWLNSFLLKKEYAEYRDTILEYTNNSGLMCRPAWTLMHKLPMFSSCPRASLHNAEDIEARLISIPSSAKLADDRCSS